MSVRDDIADRFGVDVETIDPVRVVLYAVLLGLIGFYLSPLESGLMTALKTEAEFATSPPFAPPTVDGFTLEPFGVAIDTLSSAILNSIMLAVPATVLSAFLGSFAAYGLTNFEWRGQLGVVTLFIAGIFIPYQAVLIPLSRLWAIVNTKELLAPVLDVTLFSAQVPVLGTVELATHPHYASIINLIITHAAYGIPITTLLFRSYYKKLSTEMLEAARLDGASAFTVYRRIVLPLSMPMFAVTLIYQFTQIWNDLLFALVIIPSGSGPAAVATIALNELTGGIIQTFNTQMAGAFVAALPTLLVYVLFGDKFAKGVAGEA